MALMVVNITILSIRGLTHVSDEYLCKGKRFVIVENLNFIVQVVDT